METNSGDASSFISGEASSFISGEASQITTFPSNVASGDNTICLLDNLASPITNTLIDPIPTSDRHDSYSDLVERMLHSLDFLEAYGGNSDGNSRSSKLDGPIRNFPLQDARPVDLFTSHEALGKLYNCFHQL